MDAATGALVERVRLRGGVVPSLDLVRGGVPKSRIAAAVDAGVLVRLRRRWVALPTADPSLIAAAREGVVISCVTRARRLGLWVLVEDVPHVAASGHSGHVTLSTAQVHRARPVVPRPAGALEDGIENTLDLVARCQPHEAALAVFDSALRLELITRAALERLPLSAAARTLLSEATPFSDSGLETFIPLRLKWMRLRIVAQAWIAGHRVDFLIGKRLVLQIDGGHHVGVQRATDIRHDAELRLLGYTVIRVGYHQVVDDWPGVQDLIMRAIAQGLHLAS